MTPEYKVFTEERISISGKYNIGATLFKPSSPSKAKYPAVLLIAGSGKVDRDVNIAQMKTNIFKYLAEFFAEKGIISLRYDKRGCGESSGDYNEAGISDYIDDAVSALRHLKSHDLVDPGKVIILGHSEGAFIAPAVYAQETANGLILLCGGIKPGRELLPMQPQQLAREIQSLNGVKGFLLRFFRIDKLVLWQFNRVLNQCISTTASVIKVFGLVKFNAKWLREFYNFNVRDYLPGVTCPTLVIGGEKDIQSNPNDATAIAREMPFAESHVIKDMNHLLRNYSGVHTLMACQWQYKQSVQEPLSRSLLDTIDEWLDKERLKPAV